MLNRAFPRLVRQSVPSLLAGLLPALLTSGCILGCGSASSSSGSSFAVVSGNWAITPQLSGENTGQPGGAVALPTASGSLSRAVNGAISGTLRLSPAPACLGSSGYLAVSGTTDALGRLQLTSQAVNGATWRVAGQVSSDGKTLTAATMTVSGGGCSTVAAGATGTMYTPISGTYSGNFSDSTGATVAVSTTLTQTSAPDPNGQFHLSGSATFPANSCFTSPAVTDSLVTGSTLSAVYSQQQGSVTSTVTASGTFNPDATTLTISAYSIAGGDCDGDHGVGLLTKQ